MRLKDTRIATTAERTRRQTQTQRSLMTLLSLVTVGLSRTLLEPLRLSKTLRRSQPAPSQKTNTS